MKHILAVPILILTLVLPAYIHPQDEVAERLYNEGLRKYILNDYTGAISDFDSAYRLDSENLKIKNMYLNTLVKQGNSEYERGNLAAAQRWYDRALALAGDDKELKSRLSQVRERISAQPAATAPTVSAPERRQAEGAVPDQTTLVPKDSYVASPDGTEITTIVPGQMAPLSEEKPVFAGLFTHHCPGRASLRSRCVHTPAK